MLSTTQNSILPPQANAIKLAVDRLSWSAGCERENYESRESIREDSRDL